MATEKAQTWLQKLEEQLNVDVDYMEPEYVRNIQVRPHDQTSNQIFVDVELARESNHGLLAQVAKELQAEGWLAIYTRMSVLLCKKNIDVISGRVLLQTLPSEAYSTEKTLEHARMYDREFQRAGISRERYCIKIPSTGPAMNAAKILQEEGIQTLGTALFGLAQAIACSQAGCLFISPYFNEIRAHDDLKLWPNVDDPAREHPMSARTMQILETYKRLHKETGKKQPLMKLAAFISAKEAMAAGEMGCHSATLLEGVINELSKLQYDGSKQPGEGVPKPADVYAPGPTPTRLAELSKIDPLAAADWDGNLASTATDYLAHGGEELRKAIEADAVTKIRLADALETFVAAQERSKARIVAVLEKL